MTEDAGNLHALREERLRKGERLRNLGESLYPVTTHRTQSLTAIRSIAHELEVAVTPVVIAGRIMAIRGHGAMIFADMTDGGGTLQLYIKQDTCGEDHFDRFVDTVDRGDIIECSGVIVTTQRGELSLQMHGWRMLAKALLPVPSEHFGIKDEEERYRKRYLDMILDRTVRERLIRRSVFWNSIRSFLLDHGFVEVETPVLETTPGGADARPFVTHHHALAMDVYLRISAGELWQKRLMVGGLEKTFEIGRIFRNEGMSAEHAQDYTQLELYEAYADLEYGKAFIKDLYLFVARETYGTTAFTHREHSFDLADEWVDYDFCALIEKEFGVNPLTVSAEDAVSVVHERGLSTDTNINRERAVDILWKSIRKTLPGPGFLVGVPVYLEPLAKRSEKNPEVVERFQVILAGSEVGKGFAELNDPVDQKERFLAQQALRDAGDEEAQFADMDYVEALEYGMPPTFGFGCSERLFSFLEGVSIREAQAFPLMRRK